MDIRISNYKRAAFASQETDCFECVVLVDGARVARVSNAGHGGPNDWDELPGHEGIRRRITEWAKSTKAPTEENVGGHKFTWEWDADRVIDALCVRDRLAKDLKRLLKSKLVFTCTDSKELFTSKIRPVPGLKPDQVLSAMLGRPDFVADFRKRQNVRDLLNVLPFDAALEIFSQTSN